MEDKIEKPKQAIKHPMIDMLLLGVKAGGGYKYRERLGRIPNQQLPSFIASCERQLRTMAARLLVAEKMLREEPPSYHARWEEYQRRYKEALE